MKISVRQTGGFAGLEYTKEINTAQMSATEARQVEQIVRSIKFFDFPATISGAIGADLFHYEITVIEDERRHTVAFDYDDSPQTAPLRKLLHILKP